MFIREIRSKGKTYLHLIQSYREQGKVKQKSIAALGCLSDLQETGQLRRIAQSLLKYLQESPDRLDLSSMKEVDRKRWGATLVFEKIWMNLSLSELFDQFNEIRKIRFDFFHTIFLMLIDRLTDPKSKRKSYEEQNRYHGIFEHALHHLYRALDLLADSKDLIELYLFEKNRSLLNLSVDVVFYDVTTFSFESVKADGVRDFGFSKNGKFKEVQVVFGLLVDQEGRPIGFDIFPGNTFEGHTLPKALEKLKERFHLNRLIFIADQGMLSKPNLALLKKAGYEYIVGGRLKNKPKEIQAQVLDKESYASMTIPELEETFQYKKINHGEDDLICTWSMKRAQRDQEVRQRLLRKAEEILKESPGKIKSKRGALKYIEVDVDVAHAVLDEAQIAEDTKWDGYYGMQTNCKDFSPWTIRQHYHNLWRVEESFRIFKTHLETQPMFHWTPKRIKGHLVLCFLAFLMERTLETELKKAGIEYSPSRIRKALDELQYSDIQVGDRGFYLRSQITGLANDILRALKIRIPPQISRKIDDFGGV
jgi:hypothetical protein